MVNHAVTVCVLRPGRAPVRTHHGQREPNAITVCTKVARKVSWDDVSGEDLYGDRRDVDQIGGKHAYATQGFVGALG